MKSAFTVHLTNYHSILQCAGIRYQEDAKTLIVGNMVPSWGYAIFISCRTVGTEELLNAVLPILSKVGSPFRLIKSQLLQYRLNAGAFGDLEVGKVMSIFPRSQDEATRIIAGVNAASDNLKGPIVANALRIGNLIYVQAVKKVNNKIELRLPDLKSSPFKTSKQYEVKRQSKFLGRYLNVQTIRNTPKGGVFKAINLNNFSFSWCLIKEGRPNALDDHFDRDMTDRLRWQKEVLHQLASHVTTAKVIDFFQKRDYSYLVIEYAEGTLFGRTVSDTFNRKTWRLLDTLSRSYLLKLYLKAVAIVAEIHTQGFIHRDITEGNFIILTDGRLCILDFELAFNVNTGQPDPPYLLGTIGYASPEQLQYCWPQYSDDIYSLGALLIFVLTGTHPKDFIESENRTTRKKLNEMTGDKVLTDLAMRCIDRQADRRPAVIIIIHTLLNEIDKANTAYEKEKMAIGNN
jgi:serine/threonine protein kinase